MGALWRIFGVSWGGVGSQLEEGLFPLLMDCFVDDNNQQPSCLSWCNHSFYFILCDNATNFSGFRRALVSSGAMVGLGDPFSLVFRFMVALFYDRSRESGKPSDVYSISVFGFIGAVVDSMVAITTTCNRSTNDPQSNRVIYSSFNEVSV